MNIDIQVVVLTHLLKLSPTFGFDLYFGLRGFFTKTKICIVCKKSTNPRNGRTTTITKVEAIPSIYLHPFIHVVILKATFPASRKLLRLAQNVKQKKMHFPVSILCKVLRL